MQFENYQHSEIKMTPQQAFDKLCFIQTINPNITFKVHIGIYKKLSYIVISTPNHTEIKDIIRELDRPNAEIYLTSLGEMEIDYNA